MEAPRLAERLGIDLQARLGGSVGEHARRDGPWFDPAPWCLLAAGATWALTVLRHRPCQQHVAGEPVDAFLRLCYSDVPLLYQNTALARGGLPYRDVALDQPPLTGLLVATCQQLARLLGAHPAPAASSQQVVEGGTAFLLAFALLAAACFLAAVGCMVLMGRGSAAHASAGLARRVRSWDAMYLAAAPVVLAGGLVSWDVLSMSLVVTGLLAWAVRRQRTSGVLLGLAVAAGCWPVLVLLALWLLCRRAGQRSALTTTLLAALVAWLLVDVPVLLAHPRAWAGAVVAWHERDAGLGSVWFVLQELGVRLPALSLLVVLLAVAWLAWVARLVASAPRRPRVGQVAFLLVAGWLLVNKGYSPQQVLWLAPLVPLARPRLADWAAWSLAEVAYCWAVWGHLGVQLGSGDGGPDVLYWAAIVLRVLALGWLVARVAHDVRSPWDDPVRQPLVDDPIGGVLDHAPDHTPGAGRAAQAGSPSAETLR